MKNWKIWLGIGILLRLLLMPLTVHPDLRGHYLGGYFVAFKNAGLGVYDYINKLPRDHTLARLYGDDFLVYSPLTYLSHGLFLKVLSPLISQTALENFFVEMRDYWLVFWLKTPYLLIDIFIWWLLIKFMPEKKTWATIAWAFNLPMLHSAFMMGQFDIFLVLGIVGSLLLIKYQHPTWGAVVLGLAAGFKPFPLFLLPFVPGRRIVNILIGLGTYALLISPYVLTSPGFRMYSLVAPHTDKMWYAKIMVSGSQYLPLFMIGFIMLFWWSWKNYKSLPVWGWWTAVLLLFFSVTHYHPQWFTWVSPLIIISLLTNFSTVWLWATIFISHLLILFSFEPSLHVGLFGGDLNFFELVNRFYPADKLISLVRGVLAGSSLWLILSLF